jgi:hypothetical protein
MDSRPDFCPYYPPLIPSKAGKLKFLASEALECSRVIRSVQHNSGKCITIYVFIALCGQLPATSVKKSSWPAQRQFRKWQALRRIAGGMAGCGYKCRADEAVALVPGPGIVYT